MQGAELYSASGCLTSHRGNFSDLRYVDSSAISNPDSLPGRRPVSERPAADTGGAHVTKKSAMGASAAGQGIDPGPPGSAGFRTGGAGTVSTAAGSPGAITLTAGTVTPGSTGTSSLAARSTPGSLFRLPVNRMRAKPSQSPMPAASSSIFQGAPAGTPSGLPAVPQGPWGAVTAAGRDTLSDNEMNHSPKVSGSHSRDTKPKGLARERSVEDLGIGEEPEMEAASVRADVSGRQPACVGGRGSQAGTARPSSPEGAWQKKDGRSDSGAWRESNLGSLVRRQDPAMTPGAVKPHPGVRAMAVGPLLARLLAEKP